MDTKKNLSEVAMNICSKGLGRFRDEVILAQKVGARMVTLVEEEGIGSLDEVAAGKIPGFGIIAGKIRSPMETRRSLRLL